MSALFERVAAWIRQRMGITPDLRAAQDIERDHAERMRRLRVMNLRADIMTEHYRPTAKDK